MIITTSGYQTNNLYPDIDWYNEGNFIIDETTTIGKQNAQTYIENYPFVDFEHDGEFVTKVIVLDKPEKPIEAEGKEIELVQNEQGKWEYIYVDIPLTKEQELENEILSLRTMLESLVGGGV